MQDKNIFVTVIGIIGGIFTTLFGGWNNGMAALLICMAVDYVTGIAVAAFFHNSPKSESGSLKSVAGFKGLCKKGAILAVVLIAHWLDVAIGSTYIQDMAVIAFIANETLSIVEI